jgi:hypothetical protein
MISPLESPERGIGFTDRPMTLLTKMKKQRYLGGPHRTPDGPHEGKVLEQPIEEGQQEEPEEPIEEGEENEIELGSLLTPGIA